MKSLTAALLFTLFGCATPRDIDGSDRGMSLPTGRVWINMLPESASPKSVFGIEAGATGGEGDFVITLDPGDMIRATGGTITGPAIVATEFSMIEAHIAARGGARINDRFNIHGIAGFGYQRTDVDLTSGATTLNATEEGFGPIVGVHVGFEITKWLEAYARGTILFIDINDFVISQSQQAELGGRVILSDNVSLIAAYRWWRFKQEDFSFTTDIDIRGGGVVFGIVIRF